ncbi:MAG: hypothetical protein ACRCZ2_03875 [Fusobacteriaceae bacterium]
MPRIMQVIEKKTDFGKGTADLKLYQTGFATLTKLITSVPGQTVDNATAGQDVGYQFFHDLNNKQLAVKSYLEARFPKKYNDILTAIKAKGPQTNAFSYVWKSCVDYKGQIVAGDKADYKLLQKLVNAEKELYDYRFYAQDHMFNNLNIMREWSKNRKYGSTTAWVESDVIEMRFNSGSKWENYNTSHPGITCEIVGGGDKAFVRIHGVSNIPLGGKGWVQIKYTNVGDVCYIKMDIWRNKLNVANDDGYFTMPNLDPNFELNTKVFDKMQGSKGGEYANNGNSSPHFDKPATINAKWLQDRKLI